MEGASDCERRSKTFRRLASLLMLRMSVSVRGVCWIPPFDLEERRTTLLAMSEVLHGQLSCPMGSSQAIDKDKQPS